MRDARLYWERELRCGAAMPLRMRLIPAKKSIRSASVMESVECVQNDGTAWRYGVFGTNPDPQPRWMRQQAHTHIEISTRGLPWSSISDPAARNAGPARRRGG